MSADATRHERRSAADLAWAFQVLGVAAGTSPRQVHAAVLEQLDSADFVPPPPLEQAVLLVADKLPASLWARDRGTEMFRARERELSKYVERLASVFFSLDPVKRRAAWQAARQRAAFSIPLSARLDALAAGLDVTLPALIGDGTSFTDRLANGVCKSFVMVPPARAAWREEQIERALADPHPWQAAARDLQHRYPQLLRLAPELIASLFQATQLRDDAVKQARRAEKKQAKAAPRREPFFSSRSYTWVIIVVAIMLIRGLMMALRSDTSRTPTTLPVPPPSIPNASVPPSLPSGNHVRSGRRDGANRRMLPAPGPVDPGTKGPSGGVGRPLGEPQAVDPLKDRKHELHPPVIPPSPDFPKAIPPDFPKGFPPDFPKAVPPTGFPGRRPPR